MMLTLAQGLVLYTGTLMSSHERRYFSLPAPILIDFSNLKPLPACRFRQSSMLDASHMYTHSHFIYYFNASFAILSFL